MTDATLVTVPVVFLVVSLWGALFTVNAYRPVRNNRVLLVPSFFGAWLTGELPVHHLAWQILATAAFVRAGALESWPGWVGLAVTLASWVGLVGLAVRATRAAGVVQEAVDGGLGPDTPAAARFGRRQLLMPFRMRHPAVRVRRNLVYGRASGRDLHLDTFQPRPDPKHVDPEDTDPEDTDPEDTDPANGRRRPIVVYIHGGAWVLGFRDRQGVPLLQQLAAAGWVCIRPEYRLSPGATFPDHLVDVKRAIAWAREHADELGADPRFVAVVGGSAGGQLAALAALTPNDVEYQPGFEAADTSVQACVPIYGVFDMLNRQGVRSGTEFTEFLEKVVMKVGPTEDPAAYAKASPVDRVRPDAPPFFVLHGRLDTLAPVEDARWFVDRLQSVSTQPVLYAELPGAGHVFDLFPSLRSARVVGAIERFLGWAWAAANPELATPPARDAEAGRVSA